MSEALHDIHARLGVIEKDVKQVLANQHEVRWQRWHIRTLWLAVLSLFGLKVGG